jgi:hypothetical protein
VGAGRAAVAAAAHTARQRGEAPRRAAGAARTQHPTPHVPRGAERAARSTRWRVATWRRPPPPASHPEHSTPVIASTITSYARQPPARRGSCTHRPCSCGIQPSSLPPQRSCPPGSLCSPPHRRGRRDPLDSGCIPPPHSLARLRRFLVGTARRPLRRRNRSRRGRAGTPGTRARCCTARTCQVGSRRCSRHAARRAPTARASR